MQIKTFIFVAESFKRLSFAMREHRQTSSDVWQFFRRSYYAHSLFRTAISSGQSQESDRTNNNNKLSILSISC